MAAIAEGATAPTYSVQVIKGCTLSFFFQSGLFTVQKSTVKSSAIWLSRHAASAAKFFIRERERKKLEREREKKEQEMA